MRITRIRVCLGEPRVVRVARVRIGLRKVRSVGIAGIRVGLSEPGVRGITLRDPEIGVLIGEPPSRADRAHQD